jgi:hypothetical protein
MTSPGPESEPIDCAPLELNDLSMRDILATERNRVDGLVRRMITRALESGRTMGGGSGEDGFEYTSSRPHRTRDNISTRDSISVTKITKEAIDAAKKIVDDSDQPDHEVTESAADESPA